MTKPKISIIVSVSGPRRAIGNKGALIAPISADLKRFKSLTMGHPIIMGRKTYESIGRPLPGRTNIVVTRSTEWKPAVTGAAPEVVVANSVEDALERASTIDPAEVFIIGGAEIYSLALPFVDCIYLTEVDLDPAEADAFFPDWQAAGFKEISRENAHDEKLNVDYRWINLARHTEK